MAGPGYANIFGGGSILPSWPAYLAIDLTADQVLQWPTEVNSGNGAIVAEILEVTSAAAGLTIQLSSALEVGLGYSFLVNNVGANTFSLLDNAGGTLAAIASGEVWQVYCADNSTAAGTWRIFQYGAGVSTANASTLAGAGLKAINTTLNERIAINAQTTNYAVQSTDRAALVEWTGTGGGTITLPTPAAVGADWFCFIRNSGGAAITVTPGAGQLNGAASLTFNINDSAIIVSDGADFWTIGYGQSLSSTFTFATINLGGLSGTYTLTGANLGRTSYKFIGALAGNITVVVPASQAQYWVDNETTGAYTFTVSSSGAGGTTYAISQGNRMIVYCDGLNIVPAVTLSSGTPTFPSGSAAAPGIAFSSDLTTGLYLAGNHTLGFAANGVVVGTVNATGDWMFGIPEAGISLTVNGLAGNQALELVSGNPGDHSTTDFLINRAGSTANQVGEGPSIQLQDTTNNESLVLQMSGGQIEIWQETGGAWAQVGVFDTGGNFKVAKNLTVSGTLNVVGNTTLAATTVTGAATLQSTLGVAGNTTLAATTVTGAATLQSTLGVAGNTTLAATTVTGAATLQSTLGVTGNTTLAATTVTGAATLQSTLGVTGNTTLAAATVTGAATLQSTLGVTGLITATGGVNT